MIKEKVIHYCWFGLNDMDDSVQQCIKSWKKNFPDYELMLWNESNFNININQYVTQAYIHKKFAFVSDYVRLHALYNYGGIYMDTDFEVLKNFEDLLTEDLVLSFQSPKEINSAIIAACSKNSIIKELLNIYDSLTFEKDNGELDETTNVQRLTDFFCQKYNLCIDNTLQTGSRYIIYPSEYFCPIDFASGKINITPKTVGVHNFSGSWVEPIQKYYFEMKRIYGRDYAKQAIVMQNSIDDPFIIKYSIIITYYQNPKILELCLIRLKQTLRYTESFEAIVVNDNPNEKIDTIISEFQDKMKIHLINSEKNNGYSGACNIGATIACGKYLIFLDSDAIVGDFWLLELENTAKKHPDFGAISASIIKLQTNTIEYFGMYLYGVDSIKPKLHNKLRTKFTSEDRECRIVTSTCMLISKENFEQINGFDEMLYNSHCDLDLSLRLYPKKNYVCSKSIVYHRSGTSGSVRYMAYTKARSLFFKKWYNHNLEDEALIALKEMYSEYVDRIPSTFYLLLNFSSSIYSEKYINVLQEAIDVSLLDSYSIRQKSSDSITIEDLVSWDICRLPTPIIYFADSFTALTHNKHWFKYRKSPKDLIVDYNGNIIFVSDII